MKFSIIRLYKPGREGGSRQRGNIIFYIFYVTSSYIIFDYIFYIFFVASYFIFPTLTCRYYTTFDAFKNIICYFYFKMFTPPLHFWYKFQPNILSVYCCGKLLQLEYPENIFLLQVNVLFQKRLRKKLNLRETEPSTLSQKMGRTKV